MKTGDTIQITKEARPYSSQGFTDYSSTLEKEQWTAKIRRITNTKNGRKIHFVNISGGMGHGGMVMIDDLPSFMSVEVL